MSTLVNEALILSENLTQLQEVRVRHVEIDRSPVQDIDGEAGKGRDSGRGVRVEGIPPIDRVDIVQAQLVKQPTQFQTLYFQVVRLSRPGGRFSAFRGFPYGGKRIGDSGDLRQRNGRQKQ